MAERECLVVFAQLISEFPHESMKAVRREAWARGAEQTSASGEKWGLSCAAVTFPVGLILQVAITVPFHRGGG